MFITDLPQSILFHILVRLDSCSLCVASCSSKTLKDAADEGVWRGIAGHDFPPSSLTHLQPYSSFKELVRDHNKQHAVEGFPVQKSALWRANDPTQLYYECKLLHLELSLLPENMFLRLIFDARGEEDLRSAETSALAVVTESGQEGSSKVHTFLHPSSIKKPVDAKTSGGSHLKGILSWDGDAAAHLISSMADADPAADGIASAGEIAAPGDPQASAARRLIFTYSNIGPHATRTDYEEVCLLEVPTNSTFKDIWKEKMKFCARGEAEQTFLSERDVEERARWLPHLPPALVQDEERFNRWWVPFTPPKPCDYESVHFQAWLMFPLAFLAPFLMQNDGEEDEESDWEEGL